VDRRTIQKPVIREFVPVDCDELREAALALWALKAREYQYVAVDLLATRKAMLSSEDLPWLLELAQQKSWWDSVDSLVKVIGTIVRRERPKGQRAMDRALRHEDFWIRRVAMLHQLGWCADTDTARLFRYADTLAAEKEFFIRKAIGWALRDYAWHDGKAVRTYLEAARGRLCSLSYREAGKHC
jgi:3-methyladenine DNA glycosylase AlkD